MFTLFCGLLARFAVGWMRGENRAGFRAGLVLFVFVFMFVSRESIWLLFLSREGQFSVKDVDSFVYTSGRSQARLAQLTRTLGREGLPYKLYIGVPIKTFATVQETLNFMNASAELHAAHRNTHHSQFWTLVQQIAQTRGLEEVYRMGDKPWVLWLEDDVRVEAPGTFVENLEKTLNRFPTAEIVWFSVLNVPLWNLSPWICCGMQGMVFRREAMPRLLRYIVERNSTLNLDKVLAEACNSYSFKCVVVPILGETGSESLADKLM